MYLTGLSFEALELNHRGFRTDLGDTPQGVAGREWMAKVPFVALAMGGLTLGLYTLNKRRAEVPDQKSQEPSKEDVSHGRESEKWYPGRRENSTGRMILLVLVTLALFRA